MGTVGGPQIVIILFLILLLFGARRLPELAGSIGKSMKEFRKAASEEDGGESGGDDRA
jgi:sec-independent protein translocase protein TatA